MPNPGNDEYAVSNQSGLDKEQLRNAIIIYQVGRKMGASAWDIKVALITALQESGLRNLDYGDRDSLGLFQQRPSQGWGSPQQVTDPVYSSKQFFKHLLAIDDRRSMSMTEAAQAVQRSAYPDAYAKHIGAVNAIWPTIEVKAGGKPVNVDGLDYPASPVDLGAEDTGLDPMAFASSLLAAPESSLLSAPQFGPTGQEQDPDLLAAFTSPLRDVPEDEFSLRTGYGYGKGVKGVRKAIIELASKQTGVPYVWGGTTPDGFDCSGFVQWVYAQAGIDLPRISYQQANAGRRVGLGQLRPGDLVAWDNSSRNSGADHIAIYLGNGRIIEAPRPGLGVRIRDLDGNEGAWGVRLDI